jgi:hypothetical protein
MDQNSPSSNGSPSASPNGSQNWSPERLAKFHKLADEIAQAMVDGLNRHSREKARQEAERARQQAGGPPTADTPK